MALFDAPDSIQLHFLGWRKPFAQTIADALAAIAGDRLDFSGIVALLPGGRAKRRIVDLLADLAQSRRVPMVPPAATTAGGLPELLLETPLNTAGPLAQSAAWARALMSMDPDTRAKIFPHPPGKNDFASWFRVADILARARHELAGDLRTFADLAAHSPALGDPDRWRAAADAEHLYLHHLVAAGLTDPQHARNRALANGDLRPREQLVIAGVAQMNRQVRTLIQAAAARGTRVDILVYAPDSLHDRFDDFGCVRPAAWIAAPLPLDRADIQIALAPDDVARAVFRAVAQAPAPPRPDELTIGVLDDTLAPFIAAEAAALDIPVRHGVGTPLPQTRPYQLLAAAANFLEGRRFRDFQILVRHTDLLAWLSDRWKHSQPDADFALLWNDPRPEPDWLTHLDVYASRYIPDRLTDDHARPAGWCRSADNKSDPPPGDLAWLYEQVRTFTSAAPEHEETATLPAWSAHILAILQAAYGKTFNPAVPEQLVVIQSCTHLRDALRQLFSHQLAPDDTVTTHAEAIRIALSLAAADHAVPEFTGNAVDMVGWLELMPDDAPRLLIAGFNDGSVPEPTKPDPFLNNSVRKALGLADDDTRYARDAYLLSAMLESRPPQTVTLIAGRLSAAGDPLLPSRLLFAGDSAMIAARVQAYTSRDAQIPPPLAYQASPGAISAFTLPPIPLPEQIPIPRALYVTAFRDYLASPRGFYLRYIHNGGLATIESESPRELPVMDFGSLVHAIVHEALAPPPHVATPADSAAAWEDRLLASLHKRVNTVYGDRLTASLRFQVALLEKRFQRLADWQFSWWKDGWRTRCCEWMPAQPASLDVDGKPMRLLGRIDRIDIRKHTDEIAVLDYKVCTGDKTPEDAHQRAGKWTDLQLPLYSVLAAEIIRTNPVRLGYIRISDEPKHINAALADWSPAALEDALNAAREVVRKIRKKDYTAKGDYPPTDGAFSYIFGEGLLTTEDEPDEEGEE